MKYISTPITFKSTGSSVAIERDIEDRIAMMDNLVELVVFSSQGSFNADPEFGLEYWNHEYVNISDTQFNNNAGHDEYNKQSSKERCELSIAESIMAYAPDKLKVRDINVTMNLKDQEVGRNRQRKIYSHHEVLIYISAKLDDGMGTTCNYTREVSFLVEPTVKRVGK